MATHVATQTVVPANTTSFTATLPTGWAAGDMVLVYVGGKYRTGDCSISAGWTDVTGWIRCALTSVGADVGGPFCHIFARVMQAGDAAPTVTATATVNSWTAITQAWRPATGNTWTDEADLTAVPFCWVDDAGTASPLGAFLTLGDTFRPDAAGGDTLTAFGTAPTDAGTAQGAVVFTESGLSGGTVTARAYVETAQGGDSASVAWSWQGFTGTADAQPTASSVLTGATNQNGIVAAVWLRESSGGTTHEGAVSLAVTATIGAAAEQTHAAAASLPVTATIGASMAGTVPAQAALAVTATISTAGDVAGGNVTYIDGSAGNMGGSSGTSVTITLPALATTGDLLVMLTSHRSAVGWVAANGPADFGWTLTESMVESSGEGIVWTAFREDLTGVTSGQQTFQRSAADKIAWSIVALRGVDSGTLFVAEAGQVEAGSGVTAHSTPTINPGATGFLLAAAGDRLGNQTSVTWPAGWTERAESIDTGTNSTSSSIATYDSNPAAAGAYSVTATMGIGSSNAWAWIGSVKPGAGGPTGGDIGASLAITASFNVQAGTGLPGQIPGVVPEANEFFGPICDTNGNLYVITETNAAGGSLFRLMKSSNGGQSWAEIDAAGKPTTNDLEAVFVRQDNATPGLVHVAQMDSSHRVYFHQFRTSDSASGADTWGPIKDVQVQAGTSPNDPTDQCVQLVQRANGHLLYFYRRASELVSSVQRHRIAYRKSTNQGSTWGAEVVLDTGSTDSIGAMACVVGASDKVHIFAEEIALKQVWHRSLSSADSLSAWERCDSTGTDVIDHPLTNAVYMDAAGTERVACAWLTATNALRWAYVDNDGTPAADALVTSSAVRGSTQGNQSAIAYLAVRDQAFHAMYVDDATQDLWHTSNTSLAGWTTPTEHQDAINGSWLLTNVYVRAARYRLGIVYDAGGQVTDIGDLWYDERDLGAAGTTHAAGASLAVTATIGAAATRTAVVGAALAATATVTAGATRTQPAGATLAVTATITSGIGVTRSLAATLAVTATITSGIGVTRALGAALSVTATVTTAAALTAVVGTSLPVTATISSDLTTQGQVQAQAALAVTATITTAARVSAVMAAALAVTATITAAAQRSQQMAAALAVTASIAAAAARTRPLAAVLAVTASIAASAALSAVVTANALNVTATITASVATILTAALAVTATITTAALRTVGLAATLPVTATVTAAATRTRAVAATLAVTATVTTALARTQTLAATLAATVTITAGVARAQPVAATLAVTATITTAATVLSTTAMLVARGSGGATIASAGTASTAGTASARHGASAAGSAAGVASSSQPVAAASGVLV